MEYLPFSDSASCLGSPLVIQFLAREPLRSNFFLSRKALISRDGSLSRPLAFAILSLLSHPLRVAVVVAWTGIGIEEIHISCDPELSDDSLDLAAGMTAQHLATLCMNSADLPACVHCTISNRTFGGKFLRHWRALPLFPLRSFPDRPKESRLYALQHSDLNKKLADGISGFSLRHGTLTELELMTDWEVEYAHLVGLGSSAIGQRDTARRSIEASVIAKRRFLLVNDATGEVVQTSFPLPSISHALRRLAWQVFVHHCPHFVVSAPSTRP